MDGSSMGGWSGGRWGREREASTAVALGFLVHVFRTGSILVRGRRLLLLARLGDQRNLQVTMQTAWARTLEGLPLSS